MGVIYYLHPKGGLRGLAYTKDKKIYIDYYKLYLSILNYISVPLSNH